MIKNLNINERILQIIVNQYNNNQKKFAESINYSAQVVFNIVSGRKTNPSFEVLSAIISTNDDINSEWLLTGKGSMLKSDVAFPVMSKDPIDASIVAILQKENDMQSKIIDGLEFKIDTLEKEIFNLKIESTISVQKGTVELHTMSSIDTSIGK